MSMPNTISESKVFLAKGTAKRTILSQTDKTDK